MSNLNRIILIGTVSEKPETKFGMENNSSSSRFTLAVERPPKQDGTTELDYIPIVAWGRVADYAAENLQQNTVVVVEGKIQNRVIDNNGQRNWLTEVNASSLKLLKTTVGASSPSSPAAPQPAAPKSESTADIGQNPFDKNVFTEDDVPF